MSAKAFIYVKSRVNYSVFICQCFYMPVFSKEEFLKGALLKLNKRGGAVPRAAQQGVTLLLMESASRDGDFAPEETNQILKALTHQLDVGQDSAQLLLQEALDLRERREKSDACFRSIRESFSNEQLIVVLALVWQIVLADKKVETSERKFVDIARSRLAMSSETVREAEKLAKATTIAKPNRPVI